MFKTMVEHIDIVKNMNSGVINELMLIFLDTHNAKNVTYVT